jgi:DNA (cytosine-5)-methyltransferase 1
MRYLSVCSGIEAASVAWRDLDWECAGVAEIDSFACAVLAHRFPGVLNLGNFTMIGADDAGTIDLLVGGTPCQDFSVAGLREGLGGARGRLTIAFVRLLGRTRPRWVLWENVPGVLSIDGGRAFGAFLGALGQLGYGFAYRVLDAQHFGVPQRRRRVFVVGYLGDWRRAGAVLFERESLRGDTAPRRKAGSIASALTVNGVGAGGGPDDNCAQGNHLIATYGNTGRGYWQEAETAAALSAPPGRSVYESTIAHTLRGEGFDASEDGTGRGVPLVPVAFALRGREDGAVPEWHGDGETVGALRAASGGSTRDMVAASGVRRLTPRECERLQGFPDDWTRVLYRGKPAADGPRYRALGNSMAVPCMRWIGERIALVDDIT